MIPLIGVSICERLRDRGYNICICHDDPSKHSKSYRQISSILGKIPSRDAYPSDIPNIHSSLPERSGKLSASYFGGGSISSFPITETINPDLTEFIATNVISITDRQFHTNKQLFLDSNRPAIDSALSASRIGSNAQCKLMKRISVGIKNELTYYRISELSNVDFNKYISLNNIFSQDHLFISTIELCTILSLSFRHGQSFKTKSIIHSWFFLLAFDYLYAHYIMFITKNFYSYSVYCFLVM